MITQFWKRSAIIGFMLAIACDRRSPVEPLALTDASGPLTTSSAISFQPIEAQLGLVSNDLVSANLQLGLVAHPPSPCVSSVSLACPAADQQLQSALDFYVRANGVLDDLAVSFPPGPPSAPALEALNAIIAQANASLGLLVNTVIPPGPPAIPSIILQAQHTISLANSLKTGIIVIGPG